MLPYLLLLTFASLGGVFVYGCSQEDSQALKIRPLLIPILLLYGIAFIGLTPPLMIVGAILYFLADTLRSFRGVPAILSYIAMFVGQLFYCASFAADLYPSDNILFEALLTLAIAIVIATILYFSLRNKIDHISVTGTFYLAGSALLCMLALLRLMNMLRFVEAWMVLVGSLLMLAYDIMLSAPEGRLLVPRRDAITSTIYLLAQFCVITGLCYV